MEWLETLKTFHKHLEAEEYPSAIALAPQLLDFIAPPPSTSRTNPKARNGNASRAAAADDDDEYASIRDSVAKAYSRCLLETEDFTRLKQVIEQYGLEKDLSEWHRYASYRLNDYRAALLAGDTGASLRTASTFDTHLKAQALYHLSKTDEAAALYQDLLGRRGSDDDPEEKEQVLVNWAASLLDQAAPHVRQSRSNLQSAVQPLLDAPTFPVDLAYNFAFLRLLEGDAPAKSLLEKARSHASDARDLERIRYNAEWSRHFLAGTIPSSSNLQPSDPHVQLAQLATRGVTSDDDDATLRQLTGLQSRMALYNAAVHRLRQGKAVECQKLCKSLLAAVGSHDLYWTSRVVTLQAYCCDKSKGVELLQNQLDKVRNDQESPIRDAAWLFLELHRAELAGDAVNSGALPPSMQSSNGLLASQCLLQASSPASTSLNLLQEADREMGFREYEKASEHYRQLLEQSSPTDDVGRARLVAALSHVDPQQAISMWDDGQPMSSWDHSSVPRLDDEDLNGAELEQRELPRLKTHRAVMAGGDVAGTTSGMPSTTSTKLQAAVLRRRAKKREQYLKDLEERGLYNKDRPSHPDPERWLPKAERSHYRKTKKSGGAAAAANNKSSQGGVSEKDAAKFDVVARQQQQQQQQQKQGNDTTSTANAAHLAALSRSSGGGGRKGGRRK